MNDSGEAMPKKRAPRRSKKNDDAILDTSVKHENAKNEATYSEKAESNSLPEDETPPASFEEAIAEDAPDLTGEDAAADTDAADAAPIPDESDADEEEPENDGDDTHLLLFDTAFALQDDGTPSEPSAEASVPEIEDFEYENEAFDFGDFEPDTGEKKKADDKTEGEELYNPKKPRSGDFRFDIVEIFTFTLVVIILLTTFLFRHSVVDGDSMMNTLNNGDHLIISDAFYTPKRYDIIVFEDHTTGFEKALIKRVIATGGEVVTITASGDVFVNGELISDDFVYVEHHESIIPMEYKVPEGEVFVMGDHRCCSTDSRAFGSIKEESILGKVILRFYPFADFGIIN